MIDYRIDRVPTRKPLPLAPQQRRVLDFILADAMAGMPFPSQDRIAEFMGWKSGASSMQVLHTLAYKGYIKRTRIARGLDARRKYTWEVVQAV